MVVEAATLDAVSVGDRVIVERVPTAAWITAIGMDAIADCDPPSCNQWTADSYKSTYERTVTALDAATATVFLDVPLMDAIGGDTSSGRLHVLSQAWRDGGRLAHCGVEDLAIVSVFAPDVMDGSAAPGPMGSADEEHAWKGVELVFAEHSWVRRIGCWHLAGSCVSVAKSAQFNTVADCTAEAFVSRLTGMRRYSFNVDGAMTLVKGCSADWGRHDYVSGSVVAGPNVFVDCTATNAQADIGPHHRYSTGQLYDSVAGQEIAVRDRGNSGSGHGWTGGQIVFWNVRSDRHSVILMAPAGSSNFAVGTVAKAVDQAQLWRAEDDGTWDSIGIPVFPASLYKAQLATRLGTEYAECSDACEGVNCSGHGSCTAIGACACTGGFSGNSCEIAPCEQNRKVVSRTCAPCPAGMTNAAGDNASGDDTTCDATLCASNQRVSSNACVACPAGKTSAAGDDASGDDTSCDATLCASNAKVVSHACVACAAGKTNAAGDDASDVDTSCDATLCASNQRVSSNACVACPAGKTNAVGDDASGNDTSCDATLCASNAKVVSHACVACAAGKTNAAGDDASDVDTSCDATLCASKQRVSSNACVACPAGKTNAAGNDASGNDTSCDATLCASNEKVVSHACVACAAGETNAAGDDASDVDTSCDATLCASNQRVSSNACVACPAGKTNAAGDNASDVNTSCDATLCASNEKVVSHACVACPPGKQNTAGNDASGGDTQCSQTCAAGKEAGKSCAAGSVDAVGTPSCAAASCTDADFADAQGACCATPQTCAAGKEAGKSCAAGSVDAVGTSSCAAASCTDADFADAQGACCATPQTCAAGKEAGKSCAAGSVDAVGTPRCAAASCTDADFESAESACCVVASARPVTPPATNATATVDGAEPAAESTRLEINVQGATDSLDSAADLAAQVRTRVARQTGEDAVTVSIAVTDVVSCSVDGYNGMTATQKAKVGQAMCDSVVASCEVRSCSCSIVASVGGQRSRLLRALNAVATEDTVTVARVVSIAAGDVAAAAPSLFEPAAVRAEFTAALLADSSLSDLVSAGSVGTPIAAPRDVALVVEKQGGISASDIATVKREAAAVLGVAESALTVRTTGAGTKEPTGEASAGASDSAARSAASVASAANADTGWWREWQDSEHFGLTIWIGVPMVSLALCLTVYGCSRTPPHCFVGKGRPAWDRRVKVVGHNKGGGAPTKPRNVERSAQPALWVGDPVDWDIHGDGTWEVRGTIASAGGGRLQRKYSLICSSGTHEDGLDASELRVVEELEGLPPVRPLPLEPGETRLVLEHGSRLGVALGGSLRVTEFTTWTDSTLLLPQIADGVALGDQLVRVNRTPVRTQQEVAAALRASLHRELVFRRQSGVANGGNGEGGDEERAWEEHGTHSEHELDAHAMHQEVRPARATDWQGTFRTAVRMRRLARQHAHAAAEPAHTKSASDSDSTSDSSGGIIDTGEVYEDDADHVAEARALQDHRRKLIGKTAAVDAAPGSVPAIPSPCPSSDAQGASSAGLRCAEAERRPQRRSVAARPAAVAAGPAARAPGTKCTRNRGGGGGAAAAQTPRAAPALPDPGHGSARHAPRGPAQPRQGESSGP